MVRGLACSLELWFPLGCTCIEQLLRFCSALATYCASISNRYNMSGRSVLDLQGEPL